MSLPKRNNLLTQNLLLGSGLRGCFSVAALTALEMKNAKGTSYLAGTSGMCLFQCG